MKTLLNYIRFFIKYINLQILTIILSMGSIQYCLHGHDLKSKNGIFCTIDNNIEDNIYQDSWNEVENWRGLQKNKITESKEVSQNTEDKNDEIKEQKPVTNIFKKQKKATYLNDYPEWDHVKSDTVVGIPLVKNGNLCRSVHINKLNLVVRDTCAFDSILQIVMCALASNCTYKSAMVNIDNRLLCLAQDILRQGKLNTKHYKMRGQILSEISIFEITKYSAQISALNANSNVAHLAEYLFRTIPSCIKIKSCDYCDKSNVRQLPLVNIDVNIILRNGLINIQQSIEEAVLMRGTCGTCKRTCTEATEYGSHIIIDTSILTDDNYLHDNNIEKHIYRIEDVQSNININDKTYLLVDIISYQQYVCKRQINQTGHYVAYIINNNNWYKYDDINTRRQTVKVEEIITPHLIMYLIM